MNSMVHDKIQRLASQLVDGGQEVGLQIAAYYHGELIVDVWAGFTSPNMLYAVDGNTLFPVYSTTKGITATAIHILCERGVLQYDKPVFSYWPEFIENNKQSITLRHLLNHSSGLQQMPMHATIDELCSWSHMCNYLAGSEPLWEPGTKTSYHAMTYGWLLGEVAQRADGRTFSKIVEEEICLPLCINTLHIGVSDKLMNRIASVVGEGDQSPAKGTSKALHVKTVDRAVPYYARPLEQWVMRPEVLKSCMPSVNGIMNARAIAKHYAALIGDGMNGKRLLQKHTVENAIRRIKLPDDHERSPFGLGYGQLGVGEVPDSVFGHGGYGGSLGLGDIQSGLSIGITKNRIVSRTGAGTTQAIIVGTIRDALGIK